MAPPARPVPAPRGMTVMEAWTAASISALAWRDLVNRRVSRVKLACQIIEGDFTVRTSERRLLLGRNHRATLVYRRTGGLTMAITIR